MRVRGAAAGLAMACAVSSGCGAARGGNETAGQLRTVRSAPASAPRTVTAAPARTAQPSPGPAALRPARQLVTVTAASYRATYAVFTAYTAVTAYRAGGAGRVYRPGMGQATGGRWRKVFGPWTARLGNGGLAPPGRKREGDGRTPSGTYGFTFFFGVRPDPGVAFGYRQSHPYDVWDDDPSSPLYNEWVDDRFHGPGTSPEPMYVPGYDYGAVIGYNTARTPGLGSAIFLHVNIGRATAGCVTLPEGELLTVLRWLRPGDSPRIVLAVSAAGRQAAP